MLAVVPAALAVALPPRQAEACGVVPFGRLLADLAIGLEGKHEPISEPVVIPAVGATSSLGWSGGVSMGWAWGHRQIGGLFPGSTVKRVLVHVRRPLGGSETGEDVALRVASPTEPPRAPTHLALTYGWFDNTLIDGGLDLGIAGTSTSQLGPIAQLTLGARGVGVRLSGGVELGEVTRTMGSAELVVDVAVLARRL
jgi:hypothetical protein